MIKRLFYLFLCLGVPSFATLGSLPITHSYKKGAQAIKAAQKPALLCFVASDVDAESKYLIEEIIHQQEFFDRMQNRFAFILIDFPANNRQSIEELEQNQELKERFGVGALPTLVLVDPECREVARLGVSGGTRDAFASKLETLYTEYQALCQVDTDFKKAYQRALVLGSPHLIEKFMQEGLASKENGYFLVEQYVAMAMRGERETKEARALRRKILRMKGEESENARMRLALCDFQALHNTNPSAAVSRVYRVIENGKVSDHSAAQLSRLLAGHFIEEKDYMTAKRFAKRLQDSKSVITQRQGQALLEAIEKAD